MTRIVVGSGANGGWIAKVLSEAGMKTLVLEAGPKISDADFTEHVQPYELKYRGHSPEIARNRPIQSMKYACRESNYEWFVDDILNPYTHAEGHAVSMDALPHPGRALADLGTPQLALRRPNDFKPASYDGYGEDWPVSYEELAPYYERVERYIGISGQAEGLAQLPDSVMLPPMAMMCGERAFQTQVEAKLRHAGDPSAARRSDPAAQRPRRVPLLRPVRAGLHDAFLLFELVDDAGRRAEDRQLHDSDRCRGFAHHGRSATPAWPTAWPISIA